MSTTSAVSARATSRSSSISSSIAILSPPLSYTAEDDEHILWNGSNSNIGVLLDGPRTPISEEEDYVVLSPITRARSYTGESIGPKETAASSVESLVPVMEKLKLERKPTSSTVTSTKTTSSKTRRSKRKAKRISEQSAAPTKPEAALSSNPQEKSRRTRAKAISDRSATSAPPTTPPASKSKIKPPATALKEQSIGLGERPIVDDVSECGLEQTLYEHASELIASLLTASNPGPPPSQLEILQALIIELGLITTEASLPTTLTSARTLLRSHVFVNIKDYLAVREQGPQALRQIMHKSRAALIKDLRKKRKNRAPLAWVKETGLSALLVSCY